MEFPQVLVESLHIIESRRAPVTLGLAGARLGVPLHVALHCAHAPREQAQVAQRGRVLVLDVVDAEVLHEVLPGREGRVAEQRHAPAQHGRHLVVAGHVVELLLVEGAVAVAHEARRAQGAGLVPEAVRRQVVLQAVVAGVHVQAPVAHRVELRERGR